MSPVQYEGTWTIESEKLSTHYSGGGSRFVQTILRIFGADYWRKINVDLSMIDMRKYVEGIGRF